MAVKSSAKILEVMPKFRVTIPPTLCKSLGLEVGDFLQAEIKKNRIVLTRKTTLEQGLHASLEEAKKGKVKGPFKTAKEVTEALKGK